jgi:hypothetical protein
MKTKVVVDGKYMTMRDGYACDIEIGSDAKNVAITFYERCCLTLHHDKWISDFDLTIDGDAVSSSEIILYLFVPKDIQKFIRQAKPAKLLSLHAPAVNFQFSNLVEQMLSFKLWVLDERM